MEHAELLLHQLTEVRHGEVVQGRGEAAVLGAALLAVLPAHAVAVVTVGDEHRVCGDCGADRGAALGVVARSTVCDAPSSSMVDPMVCPARGAAPSDPRPAKAPRSEKVGAGGASELSRSALAFGVVRSWGAPHCRRSVPR